MLRIDRNVTARVDAPPTRCVEVLAEVERWPEWARLIADAEVLARGQDGRVDLHVTAAIDAPGPAGLLRGRVSKRLADDLLDDFVSVVER
jgi:hypothetical protein